MLWWPYKKHPKSSHAQCPCWVKRTSRWQRNYLTLITTITDLVNMSIQIYRKMQLIPSIAFSLDLILFFCLSGNWNDLSGLWWQIDSSIDNPSLPQTFSLFFSCVNTSNGHSSEFLNLKVLQFSLCNTHDYVCCSKKKDTTMPHLGIESCPSYSIMLHIPIKCLIKCFKKKTTYNEHNLNWDYYP